MRTLDRIFGWLMVAGGLALLPFLYSAYRGNDFPSACGIPFATLLLGSMNLMRAERPHDLTLARVCVAGNALLTVLLVAVALATHRQQVPLAVAAVSVVLFALSIRTRSRSRPM